MPRRWTSGLHFDMLFGPAYKGIPLATAWRSRSPPRS
jgi:orotate phosphoribosyltransferase